MTIRLIPNWKADAFQEKKFSSVLRASFGVVGSRWDVIVFSIALASGLAVATWAEYIADYLAPASVTYKILQAWGALALGLASSILGFLIAGFSIFAAMTKKELFWELAEIETAPRKISDFKFIFFNFLFVFAHYLFYLMLSVALAFLFVKGSPVWLAAIEIQSGTNISVDLLCAYVGVLFGCYSLYILLLLRSFIWSMYQSLLIAIFADAPSGDEGEVPPAIPRNTSSNSPAG
jgi:hypothetical protein